MTDDDDRASSYRIADDQALRALDDQWTRVSDARTRLATLFAAAVAVAGILLGQIFQGHRADHVHKGTGLLLLVAFGAIALICGNLVAVWRPADVEIVMDAREMIGTYIETDVPMGQGELLRELALHMTDAYDVNDPMVQKRQRLLNAGAFAMLVEVVALACALWTVV